MSDPDLFDRLPPLRDVIAAHNLRAEKSLGQNFLLDGNITDKIVRGAGDLSGLTVFEIGPGPGGLTRSILKSDAEKLIAIEFDRRAVGALQDLQSLFPHRLHIIHANALKTDLQSLAAGPMAIIANLPYNIATPLLIGWLKQIRTDAKTCRSMTLMFQKEVAERILASPGTKAYGRLSVISQWLCNVKKIYDLPPGAFTPPPKVNSAVVHFTPRQLPPESPSFETLETVTAAAFNQRRKMIRSSLKNYAGILEQLQIDGTRRAEELTTEDYLNISLLAEKAS